MKEPTDDDEHPGQADLCDETKMLESYRFDPNYFKELEPKESYESGGILQFKLVSDDNPALYLHLYNLHNGYYAAGFSVEVPGRDIKEGSL